MQAATSGRLSSTICLARVSRSANLAPREPCDGNTTSNHPRRTPSPQASLTSKLSSEPFIPSPLRSFAPGLDAHDLRHRTPPSGSGELDLDVLGLPALTAPADDLPDPHAILVLLGAPVGGDPDGPVAVPLLLVLDVQVDDLGHGDVLVVLPEIPPFADLEEAALELRLGHLEGHLTAAHGFLLLPPRSPFANTGTPPGPAALRRSRYRAITVAWQLRGAHQQRRAEAPSRASTRARKGRSCSTR